MKLLHPAGWCRTLRQKPYDFPADHGNTAPMKRTDISKNSNQFQFFLQEAFSEKAKKNPRYSLRAFAHYLAINDSTLHQLLNGKRKISQQMAMKIGLRLGLEPKDVGLLLGKAKSESTAGEFLATKLTNDQFRLMSKWYYDAILDLASTNDFQPQVEWISKRLNVSVQDVRTAISTLERLNFIKFEKDGNLTVRLQDSIFNFEESDTSVEAARKYQIDLLQKSMESVTEVARPFRNHTSFTVRIKKGSVEKYIKKIRILQKELVNEIKREPGSRDEVYALQFAFFPLTKRVEEK